MDWLIENSAHRTTIRRDESPTLPKSNMINKDKKNTKTKKIGFIVLLSNDYSVHYKKINF
jgi:hypothetical protein